MRLVYDLFACQTGSRLRGIGRFNDSLVTAMARLRGEHRLIALADGTDAYQASTEALRQRFQAHLPAGDFACYTYPPRAAFGAAIGADTDGFNTVATTLIHQAWRAVRPDAVLLHPFEGWHEAGIAPLPFVNSDLKLIQFCRSQRFKTDTPPSPAHAGFSLFAPAPHAAFSAR